MRRGRTVLARVAVVVLLAGSLVALSRGPAHADTLTSRYCDYLMTGDLVRKLDVCVRGWISGDGNLTRGVIEMHTYKWVNAPIYDWVDSRSQSITIESASDKRNGYSMEAWGQQWGGHCRVNGPGGSVGCSVPNAIRVAFYGPQYSAPYVDKWETSSWLVSWRDDRGVPHPKKELIIHSPTWDA
jgi:hypothetical protein